MLNQQELLEHPLMAKVANELAANKAAERLANNLAIGEQQRQRAEAGKQARAELEEAIDEYQSMRPEMHEVLKRIFLANQKFEQVTGQQMGVLPELVFRQINLPSLKASNNWNGAVSTTEQACQSYFASHAKEWLL